MLKFTSFGFGFGFIAPIFYYYIAKTLATTVDGIEILAYDKSGIVLSIFSISIVLSSFPIGYLSDKHGKKKIISFGTLISVFMLIIYANAKTLPLFLLGAFLDGLGLTMWFRNTDAWIIDMLRYNNQSEEENSIISRGHSVSSLGFMLGALLNYLTNFPLYIYFYIAAVFQSLAFLVLYFISEPYRDKELDKDLIIEERTITIIKSDINIPLLFLAHAFFSFSFRGFLNIWQVHISKILPEAFNIKSTLALLFISFLACAGIGAFLSQWLSKKYQGKNAVIASLTGCFIIMISLYFIKDFYYVIALYMILEIFLGMLIPSILFWFNCFIPSNSRSRINNLDLALRNIAQSGSSFLLGKVAQMSFYSVFPIMGAALLPAIAIYAFSSNKDLPEHIVCKEINAQKCKTG